MTVWTGRLSVLTVVPGIGIKETNPIMILSQMILFIPEFIERKKEEYSIEYKDPAMEPILKETYGVIVYQEQIIQLLQVIAGFSGGYADICRRILGKKKISAMESFYKKFMQDCEENKINLTTADEIFEKLAKSAGYCFNKAHAVGYALLAYRMAYLKANFPRVQI